MDPPKTKMRKTTNQTAIGPTTFDAVPFVGVLMILLTERLQPHPNWRLFLVVGVLGGYTTFSSFEYETYQAIRGGAPWIGLANVAASVIFGYLAVCLGAWIVFRGKGL